MRSHLAIISLGASFQIQMWELGNTGWCNILKNPPGKKTSTKQAYQMNCVQEFKPKC